MNARASLMLGVLLLAACGRSSILDDDEGDGGGGSGSAGFGGEGGLPLAGNGGEGGECQPQAQAPVSLPDELVIEARPRLARSSDDGARVTVGFSASHGGPPELRHSFLRPWGAWPPPPIAFSLLVDDDGGQSFELAPAPPDRVAVLFSRTQGTPLPGVFLAPSLNPVAGTPPFVVTVDAFAAQATVLARGDAATLAGYLRPGPLGPDTLHTVITVTGPSNAPVLGEPRLVGCGQPPPVGAAVPHGSGFLVASSTGVGPGGVENCSMAAPTAGIQLARVDAAGSLSFAGYVNASSPVAELELIADPAGGYWLVWHSAVNVLTPVMLARIDASGEVLGDPLEISGEAASLGESLAATAMDGRLLVAWATIGGIAIRLVDAEGSGPDPLEFIGSLGEVDLLASPDGSRTLLGYRERTNDGLSDIRLVRIDCQR